MKTTTLEEFLGRLYADEVAQARFRANPQCEARLARLSAEDCDALSKMDWGGFELACRTFNRKRSAKGELSKARRVSAWLVRIWHAFSSRLKWNSCKKT